MSASLVTSAFETRMTFVSCALSILKSSNTTAKLPFARCSRATVPLASASTRWNVPIATVVGPDAAGLDTTLGAVAGGGEPTGLAVAPLVQAARRVTEMTTRAGPAGRCIGGLVSGVPRPQPAWLSVRWGDGFLTKRTHRGLGF